LFFNGFGAEHNASRRLFLGFSRFAWQIIKCLNPVLKYLQKLMNFFPGHGGRY